MTDDSAARPSCARCGCYLHSGHDGELCYTCRDTVASCLPYLPAREAEQAPPDVDLVTLVAGVMLTHEALHPGTKLYVREALERYGVVADHIDCWQAASKLRRRHGLIMAGDPRQPGYRVVEWCRLLPSVSPHPPATVHNPGQLALFGEDLEPAESLETALSGSL